MEDLKYDPERVGYYSPENRLEKILALIGILKYKRRKSLSELALALGKSERQIRRDIKALEKFYDIDYDDQTRPFIFTDKNEDGIYVNVTEEEVIFLLNILKNCRSPLKKGLVKKLDRNLFIPFEEEPEIAEIIDQIHSAINCKKQLLLKNYRSARADSEKDHLVEPIRITDLKYLSAFDHKDHKTKIFAIQRIEKGVKLLEEPFLFEDKHRHLQPDLFGMMTGKAYDVNLLLTNRAYLLMREEYPKTVQSISSISNKNFPWRFKEWLYGLEGVGRFIIGLINEIEIEGPIELKEYVSEQLKIGLKKYKVISHP